MKKIIYISILLLALVLTLIPLCLAIFTEEVDMNHNTVYSNVIYFDDKCIVNYVLATDDSVFYYYREEIDSEETIDYLFSANERIITNGTKFVCQSKTKNKHKVFSSEFKKNQTEYSFKIEVKSYGEIYVDYKIIDTSTTPNRSTGYVGIMTLFYKVL